jgi:hypothetical protein
MRARVPQARCEPRVHGAKLARVRRRSVLEGECPDTAAAAAAELLASARRAQPRASRSCTHRTPDFAVAACVRARARACVRARACGARVRGFACMCGPRGAAVRQAVCAGIEVHPHGGDVDDPPRRGHCGVPPASRCAPPPSAVGPVVVGAGLAVASSAPGLGLTPATSAPGLRLTPATSAPGLGLTPATSAPGLGCNSLRCTSATAACLAVDAAARQPAALLPWLFVC